VVFFIAPMAAMFRGIGSKTSPAFLSVNGCDELFDGSFAQ
jgi:hypothetical protein